MTKAKQTLINDALAAGYSIELDGSTTDLVKRTPKKNKISRGIRLFADGTAFDLTIARLDLAKGMRSYSDMRQVLGIKGS